MLRDVGRVPRRDDEPPRVGVGPDLLDDAGDLVDRARPTASARTATARRRPGRGRRRRRPTRPRSSRRCSRSQRDVASPRRNHSSSYAIDLKCTRLVVIEREALRQVEAQLAAEDAARARAGAVGLDGVRAPARGGAGLRTGCRRRGLRSPPDRRPVRVQPSGSQDASCVADVRHRTFHRRQPGTEEKTMSHVTHGRGATLVLALSTLPLVLVPLRRWLTRRRRAPRPRSSTPSGRRSRRPPTRPRPRSSTARPAHPSRPAGQQVTPSSSVPSGGPDATTWQLALSAALGALVTGGVVVGSRRFSHHGTAVAS